MHDAERRERKRDRVRHRERGHRRNQHPHVAHDEDERENEQQMVVAKEDVFDAMHEVGASDGERSAAGTISNQGREG